jgi:cytochrome c oxidase subunit 3
MTSLAAPDTDYLRRAAPPAQPVPVRESHRAQPLAHHFGSLDQQFNAAKLGMWIFLGTELLLFGGLFCLYAVYRGNHPEIFHYGSRFLQVRMGAVNTVVLILSSVTVAMAVRAAQLDRRRLLVLLLGLTVLGGAVFMGVKYFEYSHKFHENLIWGKGFYEDPHAAAAAVQHDEGRAAALPPPVAEFKPDLAKGKELWMGTCRACHGVNGEGIPGQGKDIRGSDFIRGKTDKDLVSFIKVGRMPFDPLNTTGIQMPPRGGNPMLKDEDLAHIVAFIRTLAPAEDAAPAGTGAAGEAAPAPIEEFYIPKSVVPPAAQGPDGLSPSLNGAPHAAAPAPAAPPPDPRHDPDRPQNAHIFFGIYFLMTGLHGLHVLGGMLVISWIAVKAARGRFSSAYCTPVDLAGLYWHLVDVIWIFLFPLLYLIG